MHERDDPTLERLTPHDTYEHDIPAEYQHLPSLYDLRQQPFRQFADHLSRRLILSDLDRPLIIAISGIGGSGKTRLAVDTARLLGVPHIPADHRFIDRDGSQLLRTDHWASYDFASLMGDIVVPLRDGAPHIEYQTYLWETKQYGPRRKIMRPPALIVEGVGLFQPDMAEMFDELVWKECPEEVGLVQGAERDADTSTLEDWMIWSENDRGFIATNNPTQYATYRYPYYELAA